MAVLEQFPASRVKLGTIILSAFSGIVKLTAGGTGLLLVYWFVYSMEGITTRIPQNRWQELALTSLWMLPLTLLFCSGLEDLATVTKREWVFWAGTTPVLALLYYFERNTASTILTKAAMPVLAVAGGLLPHAVRHMRFVFAVCSLAAGLAGVCVLYLVLGTLFSPTRSFENRVLGTVIVAFGISGLTTGVLGALSLRQSNPQKASLE